MESDELRFKHIGLSSDGAVIFCEMENGKAYAMPLFVLEQAEDWNRQAKPKAVKIIHDGYAVVAFDTKVKIDFPSDFVLHVCEPSYTWHKDKARTASSIGASRNPRGPRSDPRRMGRHAGSPNRTCPGSKTAR